MFPCKSSAIAETLPALMAPGALVLKGSWRIAPVAGSSTFAPPSSVPSQISPLRDSKIVMMPSALTLCGSPGLVGMDSSRASAVSFFSPFVMVPIHRAPR